MTHNEISSTTQQRFLLLQLRAEADRREKKKERKAKTKHETKTNVKIIKIATMQCDSCLSFVIPFYIILPTNPAVQIFHPFCMDTYCFKNIAVQGQTVLGLNSSLGNLLANLSLSFLICTMEMTLYDVWKETSTIPGTEYLINGNQYL